jgi:hypothetical protein
MLFVNNLRAFYEKSSLIVVVTFIIMTIVDEFFSPCKSFSYVHTPHKSTFSNMLSGKESTHTHKKISFKSIFP